MKLLKGLLFIIPIALICACGSANADLNKSVKDEKQNMKKESKMVEEGYIKAEIYSGKNSDGCPYIMRIGYDDTAAAMDPINLDKEFTTNGTLVWVKFTRLRMKNRCSEASPVSIDKIEKREK